MRLVLWIVKSDLLNDETDAGGIDRRAIFEEALTSMTWPSHIGRLAKNVVETIMVAQKTINLKADEWNRIRSALPTALWLALRDPATDRIAPSSLCDRLAIFRTVVDFTASLRTLLGRTITLGQAIEAQDLMQSVCMRLIEHGMRLTINFHLSIHYLEFIRKYGPVGSYATWSFERANRVLATSKYFRGDLVQMTTTGARRWVREQLLSGILENPAPDCSEAELAYLEDAKSRLSTKKIQGTLLLDEHRSRAASRTISIPSVASSSLSLKSPEVDIYMQVVQYLRQRLPHLQIHPETTLWAGGVTLLSKGHQLLTRVQFQGYRQVHPFSDDELMLRFASADYKRSSRDRWANAYVDMDKTDVAACRIERILRVRVGDDFGPLADEVAVVAAVRFLRPGSEEILPWSFR